jgi:hypothetical protein
VEERHLEILMESIRIELRRVAALVSRILLLLIKSLGPSVVLKGCGRRLSHEIAAKLLLFQELRLDLDFFVRKQIGLAGRALERLVSSCEEALLRALKSPSSFQRVPSCCIVLPFHLLALFLQEPLWIEEDLAFQCGIQLHLFLGPAGQVS